MTTALVVGQTPPTDHADRWERWHADVATASPVLQWAYAPRADTLSLALGDWPAAVSVHADGDIVVRLDLATDEVVGVEVKSWERAFLARHPWPLWQAAKLSLGWNPSPYGAKTGEQLVRELGRIVDAASASLDLREAG